LSDKYFAKPVVKIELTKVKIRMDLEPYKLSIDDNLYKGIFHVNQTKKLYNSFMLFVVCYSHANNYCIAIVEV